MTEFQRYPSRRQPWRFLRGAFNALGYPVPVALLAGALLGWFACAMQLIAARHQAAEMWLRQKNERPTAFDSLPQEACKLPKMPLAQMWPEAVGVFARNVDGSVQLSTGVHQGDWDKRADCPR